MAPTLSRIHVYTYPETKWAIPAIFSRPSTVNARFQLLSLNGPLPAASSYATLNVTASLSVKLSESLPFEALEISSSDNPILAPIR